MNSDSYFFETTKEYKFKIAYTIILEGYHLKLWTAIVLHHVLNDADIGIFA